MANFTAPGTGLERIQREAFLVLYRNVNDELGIIETAWAQLDEEIATELGEDYSELELERIEDRNFHLGHRPSLIEAPIDRYPNVSVMAWQASKGQPDDIDQAVTYSDRLFVEVMVKSPQFNPEDFNQMQAAESVANRRIQRTTDAVNNTLLANKTLNGIVSGIDTPAVMIGDIFIREENTSYGATWLWQGSRLDYEVRKVATFEAPQATPQMRSVAFSGIDQL